jgi:hypothetical protein
MREIFTTNSWLFEGGGTGKMGLKHFKVGKLMNWDRSNKMWDGFKQHPHFR